MGTSYNDVCRICKSDRKSTFVMFDFVSNLRDILQRNWSSIQSFKHGLRADGIINDIMDGKIIQGLSSLSDIFISFNTDGVAMFNSNAKKSLWPIIVTINNLPPALRFLRKNIIVAGLWLSHGEPDLNVFLRPFFDELRNLTETGIYLKNNIRCKVQAICCCVDSVARCKLQQIRQFNGYDACSFCMHPGSLVEGQVRYKFETNIRARNNVDVLNAMAIFCKRGEAVQGIKGISPLISIPNFNIVDFCPVDYMHAVLLGVSKQLCKHWFEHPYQECYIKDRLEDIDGILQSINPFAEISRYPRKISERKSWKANEWQNWLLIYGPVCLNGVLPATYYDHFLSFSRTINRLLCGDLTESIILECELNLIDFVQKFEILYGSVNMTYNVHLMLHICECVRNYGPLWAFSLFSYEDVNGMLKKFMKGPKEPVLQIATKYVLFHARNNAGYLDYCQENVILFCDPKKHQEEYIEEFQIPDSVIHPYPNTSFKAIKILKLNRYIFKPDREIDSKSCIRQTCCDSTFSMKIDGIIQFGVIKTILRNESDYFFLYFCIDIFDTHKYPLYGRLDNKELKLVKVDSSVKKCVRITVMDKMYVCSLDFILWVD